MRDERGYAPPRPPREAGKSIEWPWHMRARRATPCLGERPTGRATTAATGCEQEAEQDARGNVDVAGSPK